MTELEFINIFNGIITKGLMNNTYKLAWAKSLLDIIIAKKYLEKEYIKIDLYEIGEKFIEYYWDQVCEEKFFQSVNIDKPPRIYTLVLNFYNNMDNKLIGKHYNLIKEIIQNDYYNDYTDLLKNVFSILKMDVSYRFLMLDKIKYKLYEYEKGMDYLEIKSDYCRFLKKNKETLYNIIDIRWNKMTKEFEQKNKGKIKATENYNIDGTNVVIKIMKNDKYKIIKM